MRHVHERAAAHAQPSAPLTSTSTSTKGAVIYRRLGRKQCGRASGKTHTHEQSVEGARKSAQPSWRTQKARGVRDSTQDTRAKGTRGERRKAQARMKCEKGARSPSPLCAGSPFADEARSTGKHREMLCVAEKSRLVLTCTRFLSPNAFLP